LTWFFSIYLYYKKKEKELSFPPAQDFGKICKGKKGKKGSHSFTPFSE
jgi:hypothetical protein